MTRRLPDGDSLLIRTDFSDDALWRHVADIVSQPQTDDGEVYVAELTLVDDRAFDGITLNELVAEIATSPHSYIFVVDSDAIADPEHSVLAVDTSGDSGDHPTFRVHPSQMPTVESNLSIDNMDFEEFSSAVAADGVFRGFE